MENLLNSFSDKSRPIFIWEDINLQGVPKNVQKGAKLTNGHFWDTWYTELNYFNKDASTVPVPLKLTF